MFTWTPAEQKPDQKSNQPDKLIKKHLGTDGYEQLSKINKQISKELDAYAAQVSALELQFNKHIQSTYTSRSEYLRKVPGFWSKCLTNHKDIKMFLDNENVVKFLTKHLVDIEIIHAFDPRFGAENVKKFGKEGLVIKMEFSKNDVFENPFLHKAIGKKNSEEDYEVSFCEGTRINWKSDKIRQEFTDQDENTDTEEDIDWFSFFGWFESSADELSDDASLDTDGMDKITKAIVEEIWPNPMDYYTMEDNEDKDESESDVQSSESSESEMD